jgi:hypothetical protein
MPGRSTAFGGLLRPSECRFKKEGPATLAGVLLSGLVDPAIFTPGPNGNWGLSELRRMAEIIVDKEANNNNCGTRTMKRTFKHSRQSEQRTVQL